MGMDVYGINPTNEDGQYFRNNVWWWHPLWEYCCVVSSKANSVINGHSNDGDGLNEQDSKALAETLLSEINKGYTKIYQESFENERGEHNQENWSSWYSFSVDNVEKFANFLANCGGFEIC